jgi:uncharacterized membrane protein
MPHSYAVRGVVVIVDKANVVHLDMNPADAMKMAVSGGAAGYENEADRKLDHKLHFRRHPKTEQ